METDSNVEGDSLGSVARVLFNAKKKLDCSAIAQISAVR